MGEEATFLAKYAPYYVPILSAVILIIFTKNYLFRGMISVDVHQSQIDREREIIKVQETVSNQLEEIVRQLEALTCKVSEDIKENTERLHTLELVFSDNIEAVRNLALQVEKHRKNIPETQEFRQIKGKTS